MYPDLWKIEKVVGQNSALQLRASRALSQLLTSKVQSYMHHLSRCCHRQWIANGEYRNFIKLSPFFFFQVVNLQSRAAMTSKPFQMDWGNWICEKGVVQRKIQNEETTIWLHIRYGWMFFKWNHIYMTVFMHRLLKCELTIQRSNHFLPKCFFFFFTSRLY